MLLSNHKLRMLNAGHFKLDGGAMHGVVPKTIWSKLVACDGDNRVTYTTHCLLIETASGERVLVETGNGDKFSAKERAIYGIEQSGSIEQTLHEAGVDPASIDFVVLSHLHFDHVGGAVARDENGRPRAVFPRAKHIIQRRELDDALHPHERNRASYLQENLAPLVEKNLFHAVDGDTDIAAGVRVIQTPGHTAGHQSVVVGNGTDSALFLGDVVPTSVHLKLPFIMAYDLDVVATLESKRRILTRAIDDEWIVLFGHDQQHGARIKRDDRGQPTVREYVRVE